MKQIVLALGVLGALACSKDRPPDNAAASMNDVTAAPVEVAQPVNVRVEEIRASLLERRPTASEEINKLVIYSDDGFVTLRGTVEDEETHAALIDQVRAMPKVRGVRDQIEVVPKAPATIDQSVGTTSTMPAELPAVGPSKSEEVRQSMVKAKPNAEKVIDSLTIMDDGTAIILTGVVPDEATHKALVKAAKETPGVADVKDELKVGKADANKKTP